jgi:hypothetical protein
VSDGCALCQKGGMIYSVGGVPLHQGCLDWITSDEPCEDEILRATMRHQVANADWRAGDE